MRRLTLLALLGAMLLTGCVNLRAVTWVSPPRSGDAALDEVLKAIEHGDVPRIASLVGSVDVPCVTAWDWSGPVCPTGTAAGTAIPAIWLSGSGRGGSWVRLDAVAPGRLGGGISSLELARDIAGDRSWIVAVAEGIWRGEHRVPEGFGPSGSADVHTFSAVDFTVFVAQHSSPGLLAPSGEDGVAVLVRYGRIVGVEHSGGLPGGDLPLWVEAAATRGRVVLPPSR
ncbi:MAG: hypothetical protein AB7G21_11355 [Dehalococcoidia bacterium]